MDSPVIALVLFFLAWASFTASTTAYTSSNEISGTNYSAKGQALNPVTPTASGTTALMAVALPLGSVEPT